MKKLKKKKTRNRIKPKKNHILRLAAAAFFVFILVTIVNQQIKIQQSRSELEDVNSELELAQMKTLDLEKKSQLAEQASELTVNEVSNPSAEASGESGTEVSDTEASGAEASGESSDEGEAASLTSEASKAGTESSAEASEESKTEEEKECEEYLRQEALRLGYAKSGVRVFQNIAGN